MTDHADEFDGLPDEIIGQSRRFGSDLSQPHGIDFYFHVPSEAKAREVAAALDEAGFTTTIRPPLETQWLCLASQRVIPTVANLTHLAQALRTVAADPNVFFDGWEGDVVHAHQGDEGPRVLN